ncbi:hypothetical protein [Pantoea sp. At-9b]|uniref:hypothetical protein n=1 Tax=Pantoea sp. (strain At-9b) TaxID=592316 RepID=UPI00167F51EF|nr:hypothetical protein [Pantoea sp. At-9b]
MSRNTPDTTERRGGIKGRSAPGECNGDSRLQPLTFAIRPWPGGPEHAPAWSGGA